MVTPRPAVQPAAPARTARFWLDLSRRDVGAGRLVLRADPAAPAPHAGLAALRDAPWSDVEDGWVLGRVWDFDVFEAALVLASGANASVLPRAATALGIAGVTAPLAVELVPAPCRSTSSCSVLGDAAWRRRAERFTAAAGRRCNVCGRSANLVADVYAYLDPEDPPPPAGTVDARVGIRRFVGWELSCPLCWVARHPGLATTAAASAAATSHLAMVNQWLPDDVDVAVLGAWRTWRRRSAHAWRDDFEVLADRVETAALVRRGMRFSG